MSGASRDTEPRAGGAAPPDSEHGAPIKIPPPALYLAGFLAGVALRWVLPGDALPPGLAAVTRWVGLSLVAVGLSLSFTSVGTFWRAKTTTIPHKAATRLVAHGLYRFTRNPMYLGLNTTYVGSALALNRVWPLALFPLLLVILIRAVIRVEERYLAERFGEEYRAYRARVRRFL